MGKKRRLTFEGWMKVMRKVFERQGWEHECSEAGWREYYDAGYAPREALNTDLSYQ